MAADAIRPAGLRAGIAALTAVASAVPDDAMIADLTATGGAVSALGADPIFIVAPPRAIEIQLRARREFPYQVLLSPALAAGDVIAVSPIGLASVLGDDTAHRNAQGGNIALGGYSPVAD